MANFAPTEIQQVADFTPRAGDALLNIMGRESNPYNNIMNLVDRTIGAYTKAKESEAIANANAQISLALENGKSVPEAYAGIESRILGNKAIQERTDDVINSLLNRSKDKRDWQTEERLAREAALRNQLTSLQIQKEREQRVADSLIADFQENQQRYNGYGDQNWYDAHKKELLSNPLARKLILDKVKTAGSSLSSAPIQKAIKFDGNSIDDGRAKLNEIEEYIGRIGVTKEQLDYAVKHKSMDDYIQERIKALGYTGEDARDFSTNASHAWKILENKVANLGYSSQLVPMLMRLSEYDPAYSWLSFGTRQFDYDPSKVEQFIRDNGGNFRRYLNDYEKLQGARELLNNSDTKKAVNALKAQYEMVIKNATEDYSANRISVEKYQDIVNQATRSLNANLQPIVNEYITVLNRHGDFQK